MRWVAIRVLACLLWAWSVLTLSFGVAADLKPAGDPKILPAEAKLELLWDEGEFTEGVAVGKDAQAADPTRDREAQKALFGQTGLA